ncbi:MAG: D-alanine--D-alanine ligase [Candidatus Margulisbacteria bacterium]|nr:D-alanine--D-alanine ligase [Candidatus Margulisiibacteriota bacterium]
MRSPNHSINKLKSKRIAVVGGGVSAEREVSLKSAQNVSESLERLGLDFIQIDPSEDSFFSARYDIAFNCLHGQWGEDGGLQGYCELRNIPYTGPGVRPTSIAFNKPIFKAILNQWGIPTPTLIEPPLSFPFIVKPVSDGSSIGIFIVRSKTDWEQLIQTNPVVQTKQYFFEEYIQGQEITIGVINIENEVVVMPALEIKTCNEFYDYEAKYTPGKTEYIVPANIESGTLKLVQQYSLDIYKKFDCKGCVRIDIIIDKTGPKILEMNTNPGLTKGSNVPAQARAMGIDFDALVLYYLNGATH